MEEAACSAVHKLVATTDIVVTGGGSATAVTGETPDPVLHALNILVRTFEDESESEEECEDIDGQCFNGGSDDDGGLLWSSDGEGEAAATGW